MKLVLLGAPGAGKGTQAVVICKKLSIPAISTGSIIRDAIKAGTQPGLLAKQYVRLGQLVPDEIVIDMLMERISQSDCKNGYILDGFPRNIAQAEALEHKGIIIDRVIEIKVDDEVIIERLSGRRVCEKCGASYHLLHNPSGNDDSCEVCSGKLIIRGDDSPEVVRDRLKVYHEQTAPLKGYYENLGKLRVVVGAILVEETTRRTLAALELESMTR